MMNSSKFSDRNSRQHRDDRHDGQQLARLPIDRTLVDERAGPQDGPPNSLAVGRRCPRARATVLDPLIIDLDATLVTAHWRRRRLRRRSNTGFGFHLLCAFADHGPQGTGEPLSILLRAGNAGSNTAADHQAVIADALDQVGLGPRPGRRVLIRIDGAGATKATLETLTRRRVSYSVGFTLPMNTAISITWFQSMCGPRHTTPTASPVTARMSQSSPGCSTWPAGPPGCGSSSAANGPILALSCGSTMSTATG